MFIFTLSHRKKALALAPFHEEGAALGTMNFSLISSASSAMRSSAARASGRPRPPHER